MKINLIGGAKKEFEVCFGLQNNSPDNLAMVEIWPMISTFHPKHGNIKYISNEIVRMPLIRNGYTELACLDFADFRDGKRKLKRDDLKNAEFFISVRFACDNSVVVGTKSLPISSVVYIPKVKEQ